MQNKVHDMSIISLLKKWRSSNKLGKTTLIGKLSKYSDVKDDKIVYNFSLLKNLNENESDYWCTVGIIFSSVEKHDLAQQAFYKSLDIDESSNCIGSLIYTFRQTNNHDAVKELYRELLNVNPEDLSSIEKIANSCMNNGEYIEAVKYYELYLKLEPQNTAKLESLKQAKSRMVARNEKAGALIDVLNNDITGKA